MKYFENCLDNLYREYRVVKLGKVRDPVSFNINRTEFSELE